MHTGLGVMVWMAAGSDKVVIAEADAGEGQVIAIGVEDPALTLTAEPGPRSTAGGDLATPVATAATPPPVAAPTRERRSPRSASVATALAPSLAAVRTP
ncbi:MAG TPA: hypothetical protein VGG33_03820, partial [Polyangia bacterium]